jgi:hypothetical protein
LSEKPLRCVVRHGLSRASTALHPQIWGVLGRRFTLTSKVRLVPSTSSSGARSIAGKTRLSMSTPSSLLKNPPFGSGRGSPAGIRQSAHNAHGAVSHPGEQYTQGALHDGTCRRQPLLRRALTGEVSDRLYASAPPNWRLVRFPFGRAHVPSALGVSRSGSSSSLQAKPTPVPELPDG